MIIKEQDLTVKGTRIIVGNEKRKLINSIVDIVQKEGFVEIEIPILQYEETFANKIGEENNLMMYRFKDKGDRDLCLAPEYTAIVQKLALKRFKYEKDVKLFYVAECFRGENVQKSRYRQFTQFGVEILNPTKDYTEYLENLACTLIATSPFDDFVINTDVTRGLDYYKDGKGFEIRSDCGLQLCGGGSYNGGIGFAIGISRIYDLIYKDNEN